MVDHAVSPRDRWQAQTWITEATGVPPTQSQLRLGLTPEKYQTWVWTPQHGNLPQISWVVWAGAEDLGANSQLLQALYFHWEDAVFPAGRAALPVLRRHYGFALWRDRAEQVPWAGFTLGPAWRTKLALWPSDQAKPSVCQIRRQVFTFGSLSNLS